MAVLSHWERLSLEKIPGRPHSKQNTDLLNQTSGVAHVDEDHEHSPSMG